MPGNFSNLVVCKEVGTKEELTHLGSSEPITGGGNTVHTYQRNLKAVSLERIKASTISGVMAGSIVDPKPKRKAMRPQT